jgi:hypothetical protein
MKAVTYFSSFRVHNPYTFCIMRSVTRAISEKTEKSLEPKLRSNTPTNPLDHCTGRAAAVSHIIIMLRWQAARIAANGCTVTGCRPSKGFGWLRSQRLVPFLS